MLSLKIHHNHIIIERNKNIYIFQWFIGDPKRKKEREQQQRNTTCLVH